MEKHFQLLTHKLVEMHIECFVDVEEDWSTIPPSCNIIFLSLDVEVFSCSESMHGVIAQTQKGNLCCTYS